MRFVSVRLVSAGWHEPLLTLECAIHALAPTCENCGCRIIGHGTEANGPFYCCAHCAHRAGLAAAKDRL